MNTRIKELRKNALNMTQADFGARIGINSTTVAGYETGRRSVSDAVVLSICRELSVSEAWLRYGTGEMFVSRSKNEEIAMLVNDIMSDQDDSFRKRFIAALADLGPEEWQAIEDFAWKLVGGKPEK